MQPLWFQYPSDANTYPLDLQFFFGDSILVSPVTEENSTSVDIYLPEDVFYDFTTFETIQGNGSVVTLPEVGFTEIPVYIRGGKIVPLRVESAITTAELREKPFEIVVAVGKNGTASGSLYLDDGESLQQSATSFIQFNYQDGLLTANGTFDYQTDLSITQVRFLGLEGNVTATSEDGSALSTSTDGGSIVIPLDLPLTGPFTLNFGL